ELAISEFSKLLEPSSLLVGQLAKLIARRCFYGHIEMNTDDALWIGKPHAARHTRTNVFRDNPIVLIPETSHESRHDIRHSHWTHAALFCRRRERKTWE